MTPDGSLCLGHLLTLKPPDGATEEVEINLDETFTMSGDKGERHHNNMMYGERVPTIVQRTPDGPPDMQHTLREQLYHAQSAPPSSQFDMLHSILNRVLEENSELKSKSLKRLRGDREDDDIIEQPIKIIILEGPNDAWTFIHHKARNLRPYCGDWEIRFKSLGKKAKPAKETLD